MNADRLATLLIFAALSGCGGDYPSPGPDQGLTMTQPAPLTVAQHYNVAATITLNNGAPCSITYDHTLFSDQSITVTGTISTITPNSNTRTFTPVADGGAHGDWYDTNPAIFNLATEQWTICVDQTHANHISVVRQPFTGTGNDWYIPIGGNAPDLVSFPGQN